MMAYTLRIQLLIQTAITKTTALCWICIQKILPVRILTIFSTVRKSAEIIPMKVIAITAST